MSQMNPKNIKNLSKEIFLLIYCNLSSTTIDCRSLPLCNYLLIDILDSQLYLNTRLSHQEFIKNFIIFTFKLIIFNSGVHFKVHLRISAADTMKLQN